MESETYDEGPSKAAQEIKKTLNLLVVATVVLFFMVLGGVAYTWTVSKSNHDALCAYKKSLQSNIVTSEKFIVKHPGGFGGITIKEIQDNIDEQRKTLRAFDGVRCG